MKCATPGCRADAGHGNTKLFCKPCAAVLARVRDEYLAEWKDGHKGWWRQKRAAQAAEAGLDADDDGDIDIPVAA